MYVWGVKIGLDGIPSSSPTIVMLLLLQAASTHHTETELMELESRCLHRRHELELWYTH